MTRPARTRTPELAETLVEGLYQGITLRALCREHGISKSEVYRWIQDDDDFSGRIARAREHGFHEIADECVEIADDREDKPDSRKVRVWTRLQLLSKWDPKRYGELIKHAGADGVSPVDAGGGVAAERIAILLGRAVGRLTDESGRD